MAAEQVVLLGVAGLGVVLLVVRAVLARDEPWWARWPMPLGAAAVVAAVVAGLTARQVAACAVLVGLGLLAQLVHAYRRGRYLEDDVASVWRRLRGRPAPRRGGRHRVRDD